MIITNRELVIPGYDFELEKLSEICRSNFKLPFMPIRFVSTRQDADNYYCEVNIIEFDEDNNHYLLGKNSIFDYRVRKRENQDSFNVVLIIPTGVDAAIGGDCGDANVVARLVASDCDTLITHPNVVNASDLNELPENGLYVEGSILTKFLMGQIGLQKVRSNRMLILMDKHEDKMFNDEVVNAVSSARITLGIDCDVYEMDDITDSNAFYSKSGRAVGEVRHLERLFGVIERFKEDYDVIGLSTFIHVPNDAHEQYFDDPQMVNIWGGIEAMITHSISEVFRIPCAHSPMMSSREVMDLEVGVVEPTKAPETSSLTYLHCVLKGLHKSPKIVKYENGMNAEDVSCMIIPDGCLGLPVLACLKQGIPIIAVSNKNLMKNDLSIYGGKVYFVKNYFEAIGMMHAIKAGISIDTLCRPIPYTKVIE